MDLYLTIYVVTLFQISIGALPLFVIDKCILKRMPEIVFLIFLSFVSTMVMFLSAILIRNNVVFFNAYFLVHSLLISVFFLRGFKQNWVYFFMLIVSTFPFISFIVETRNAEILDYSMWILWLSIILRSVLMNIYQIREVKSIDGIDKLRIEYNAIVLFYTLSSFIMAFFMKYLMSNYLWVIHNILETLFKLAAAYLFWKHTQLNKGKTPIL